jgi:dihydrofolate reductase
MVYFNYITLFWVEEYLMLSIIAAMDNNNVIGRNNSLIWRLPRDLKRFKEITLRNTRTIIMGRKTFDSLPGILPERKHIILTGNPDFMCEMDEVQAVHDVKDLEPFINSSEEYYVIGGGKVFSLLLPFTQRMYLTIVHESFKGDAYFPSFNKEEWRVIHTDEYIADAENPHDTTFLVLERV